MSQPTDGTFPPAANENLPPVEPPGAGFLLQLFGIPAIIVTIIVAVWVMFNWLAQRGNNVDGYLKALERDTPARWQAAAGLADLTRDRRDSSVRLDPEVAQKLADALDRETVAGKTDLSSLNVRHFLCDALGEFQVPGLLPPLERAVAGSTRKEESPVRFAALRSIAIYIDANRTEGDAARDRLLPMFAAAAEDEETLIRSTAAFDYYALRGDEAIAGLNRLLGDFNIDVRFNAATLLAKRGQISAIDTLLEMLDPQVVANPVADKTEAANQENRRMMIQINALRAVEALAKEAPQLDFSRLRAAIQRLQSTQVSRPVRYQAAETLRSMDERNEAVR